MVKLELEEMLTEAIFLSASGHKGQYDKAKKPYVLHPMKVMHYLKTDDIELMCIGLLHDYIEDVEGASYQQLRDIGFSERVIEGIRCLTKVKGETYEEYQLKVLSNVDAMHVKLADLRHNSDIRRQKNKELKDSDIERLARYSRFYLRIQAKLDEIATEEQHIHIGSMNIKVSELVDFLNYCNLESELKRYFNGREH